MSRVRWVGVLFVAAALVGRADEVPRSAAVKKLAQELGDATLKGDCAKVIDHTYDTLIKEMGGREKAIELVELKKKEWKARGITIKAFTVAEPGELLTEGAYTFVVIPTSTEVTVPGARAILKSYLLGISSDEGKTWKFADGAGIAEKERRNKLLPKLPANLKLPEPEKPEVVKD
jgi:hypothetical protein